MEEMFNNYNDAAKKKVKYGLSKTLLLAILAGAFIALAAATSTYASNFITNKSLAKIISGLIFPFGFILVILFKTEFFTGNCLLIISKLKKEITFKEMFINLIIVFIGNFIGAIFIAYMLKIAGCLNVESIYTIAYNKINFDFLEAFFKGILCNILVCMAVLLSFSVKTTQEKILVIFIPIFLFIVLGLEHVVANMYYIFAAHLGSKAITIKEMLLNNIIPVTLGNIIGGMTFAFIIYEAHKSS